MALEAFNTFQLRFRLNGFSDSTPFAEYSAKPQYLFTNTGCNVDYTGCVTSTAIPEPATYNMMLAGLGLLGFVARRRKQATA